MDQKFQETNLKFEVTYQQIEIFKVFEKKRKQIKKMRKWTSNLRKQINFKVVQKQKRIKNYWESSQKYRKNSWKIFPYKAEMDLKFW